MLKLVFDIKCGYEKEYIEVKDYSFDITFLCHDSYYNILNILTKESKPDIIPTENDLFIQYTTTPEKIIKDYKLGATLLNYISSDIGARHFREILSEDTAPLVFPELFTMKNIRLEMTDEALTKEEEKAKNDLINIFKENYDLSDEEIDDIINQVEDDHKYEA